MADYFKDENSHQKGAAGGVVNLAGGNDLPEIITEQEEDNTRASSPQIVDHDDEELPTQIKETLVARLEEEILGNIDVNFLFNKGDKLRFSLIDQHRLYKIMLKIKEVAHKQIQEKRSK